jgi:membrane protein
MLLRLFTPRDSLAGRRLLAAVRQFSGHQLSRVASAMAFNLFLAAIPMLGLAGWLMARLLQKSPHALDSLSLVLDLAPAELHELILRHFERFSVGAVAPFAVLGSLWLASSAFHTLMSVFETAVGARPRPFWQKRALSVLCVLVAICAFGMSGSLALAIAGGPAALLQQLGAGAFGTRFTHVVTLVVSVLITTALLAAFFRIAVQRPGIPRRVWPGAAMAVGIGCSASYAFAYYAATLAEFSLYYGSLAAVAVGMVWLWLWCAALLLGAELNVQLENRTNPGQPASEVDIPTQTP